MKLILFGHTKFRDDSVPLNDQKGTRDELINNGNMLMCMNCAG